MSFELLLAGFIMAVGLAIAGTGSYFYQWVIGQQAMLRFAGKTWPSVLPREPRRPAKKTCP